MTNHLKQQLKAVSEAVFEMYTFVRTLTDQSQCYKSDTVPQSTHCPVCSPPLNNLARFLPYSHSANSKLVCYISGDPLNEDNPPLMLPNGYVYSTMSVAAGASFGNYFVCPRTKQEFSISDAEKIYIM